MISFHYGTMPEIKKKIRDGRLMAPARVWNSLKYFILTRNHVFTGETGEFDASLYFAVIPKHYIGLCNWCIFTLGLHQWRNSLHRITSFLQAYLKYFLCEHLTIRISLFFYWFWLLFVVRTLLVSIFCPWPVHCNSRGYISASRQWHQGACIVPTILLHGTGLARHQCLC